MDKKMLYLSAHVMWSLGRYPITPYAMKFVYGLTSIVFLAILLTHEQAR